MLGVLVILHYAVLDFLVLFYADSTFIIVQIRILLFVLYKNDGSAFTIP